MVQNNLARNLTDQPQPYVSTPDQAQVKRVSISKALKLSSFEKLLIVCGSAVLTVL